MRSMRSYMLTPFLHYVETVVKGLNDYKSKQKITSETTNSNTRIPYTEEHRGDFADLLVTLRKLCILFQKSAIT